MGKAGSILSVVTLIVAATLSPWKSTGIQAQSSPVVPCSQQPPDAPMQGHYTGPWHSDGDYHFTVNFPPAGGNPAETRDLELKIVIDGTLDLTVSADGQVTGTATGKVSAPIFHDGQQDISTGTGTLSGNVNGSLTPTGPGLVLSHPVIDMHWGTFDGPNVERWITMPDYRLPANGSGCISARGSVSEDGFPLQNVTNDSTGQLTQAPGVGTASGTWQLDSDRSATFNDLSQKVDAFIAQANALFADMSAPLTPALVDQKVVQPLKTLESTIRQDPDVSRCLLARIAAWESSVLPSIFQRAGTIANPATLAVLRQAGDLVRSAHLLAVDCQVADGGAEGAVLAAGMSQLDRSIADRDWPDLALLLREILLFQGEAAHPQIEQRVYGDLHSLLSANTASPLDVARIAYALGDDADVQTALHRSASHLHPMTDSGPWQPSTPTPKKGKKQPKRPPRPRAKSAPRAKPSPTPTSTPTPRPQTLPELLTSNLSAIQTAGSATTLSWHPVPGAQRYLVFVTGGAGPKLQWSWSGSATSVTYGDTSIEGLQNTANDGWSLTLPSDAAWSVLALNAQGQIIAARLR